MRYTCAALIRIAGTARLRSTVNGNPQVRVLADTGVVYETKPDAAIAFSIENREFRDTAVLLHVTDGFVVDALPADDEGVAVRGSARYRWVCPTCMDAWLSDALPAEHECRS